MVEGRLVRAGAITRADEPSGAELLHRRVRVYWAGECACFDGIVQAWDADGGVHRVLYDDGMVCAEVLPSEDTPHYRVLS